MRPVRAASTLALVALVATSAGAAASPAPRRRVVAVVNAARDSAAGAAAAAAIRRDLALEPRLSPVPAGALTRALEGPLPDSPPGAAALAAARAHLTAARDAVARFDYHAARAELRQADAAATPLAAEAPARALLAGVDFERGLVALAGGDRHGALAAFAVAHRLDPARGPLDPARYPPEVCAAWRRATEAPATRVSLRISAPRGAAVFVDGSRVGTGNSSAKVAPGIHYVASASREYKPEGARIAVPAGAADAVALAAEPLATPARAERLRRDLAAGNTPLRSGVNRALALTSADVAVAIRGRAGALEAAVFDGTARPTTWRPLAAAATAAAARDRRRLIADLLPPPAPPIAAAVLTTHPAPKPVPWYRRHWAIATIGGGVAAVVVAVLTVSLNANEKPQSRDVQGIHF